MQRDKDNKALIILLLIVSLLGFADATYLTAEHYVGGTIACSIFHGCEEVTNSQYSVILGVPLAILGALCFFAVFIMFIIYSDSRRIGFIKLAMAVTSLGFLLSLVLVYIQLGVLHAICPYCMSSALFSTLLFIGSWYLLSANRKRSQALT